MVELDSGFIVEGLKLHEFGALSVSITHKDPAKVLQLHEVLEDQKVEHTYSCAERIGPDKILFKRIIWPKINFYIFCLEKKEREEE